MMNRMEEAIIYATIMHQGKARKLNGIPYILHPLEVAQILATITDNEEVITAGILHDIVEGTDGTLAEIEKRFGKRVAELVLSESENDYPGEKGDDTWQRRKEASLRVLKNNEDIGVKMLWLADKLANIRALARMYSEMGEEMWSKLSQTDSAKQRWYYRKIGELLELSLNRTGAFKEYVKHVNSIWPGTFDSSKARYRKYHEASVEGCKIIGRGVKGDVYRHDDEFVIKVYNQHNTYRDVEREIAFSRKAFVLGLPTAISFGIVSVGKKYGAVYELVEADTISRYIAVNPAQVETYAQIMATLAHRIHRVKAEESDGIPPVSERLKKYIKNGIAQEDEALGRRCTELIDALPACDTLLHGDFHTSNVFLQRGEPIIIDMDRVSVGHPIAEISDLYYFYVILGEEDPSVVENFMGFSYNTARQFYDCFLKHYLGTEKQERLQEVTEKASLLGYSRLIRRLREKEKISEKDQELTECCVKKIAELTERIDSLAF